MAITSPTTSTARPIRRIPRRVTPWRSLFISRRDSLLVVQTLLPTRTSWGHPLSVEEQVNADSGTSPRIGCASSSVVGVVRPRRSHCDRPGRVRRDSASDHVQVRAPVGRRGLSPDDHPIRRWSLPRRDRSGRLQDCRAVGRLEDHAQQPHRRLPDRRLRIHRLRIDTALDTAPAISPTPMDPIDTRCRVSGIVHRPFSSELVHHRSYVFGLLDVPHWRSPCH